MDTSILYFENNIYLFKFTISKKIMTTQSRLSTKVRTELLHRIGSDNTAQEREHFYQVYHSLLRTGDTLDRMRMRKELENAGSIPKDSIAPFGPGWEEEVREQVSHLIKVYREFPEYVRQIYSLDVEEIEKKARAL